MVSICQNFSCDHSYKLLCHPRKIISNGVFFSLIEYFFRFRFLPAHININLYILKPAFYLDNDTLSPDVTAYSLME